MNSNDSIVVKVPAAGHLRLIVVGEEDTPVDLAPYANLLLKRYADQLTADTETDASGEFVDFALLESSDDVIFQQGEQTLPSDEGLRALASMVRLAIIDAVTSPNPR